MFSKLPFLCVLLGIIFVLVTGCPSSNQQAQQPTPKKKVKTPVPNMECVKLFNQGKYKQALKPLLARLEKVKDDPELQYMAGRAAYENGEYELATKLLSPLVENKIGGQTEALAWQFIAQSAMENNKKDEAIKIFKAVRERYADDPGNLRAMVMHEGNIYWKSKEFDEALKVFDELIKIGDKEQEPGVVLQKALVQRDAGQPEKSKKTFEKIIARYGYQPNIANEARLHLAKYYIEKGKLNRAQDLIDRAESLKADSNRISALLMSIASQYAKSESFEKTESYYLRLLERFEKKPKILNNIRCTLGTYYLENKKPEKALDILKKVAKGSPDDKQKQWAQDSINEIKL